MSENPWSPRYFVVPRYTWRFITSWAVHSRIQSSGQVTGVAGPFRTERQAERVCRAIYDAWEAGYSTPKPGTKP